jgi:hypothetical protein
MDVLYETEHSRLQLETTFPTRPELAPHHACGEREVRQRAAPSSTKSVLTFDIDKFKRRVRSYAGRARDCVIATLAHPPR